MISRIVDEHYIPDVINQLHDGKASGSGKVSITIVKGAKDLIAKTLTIVYNDSAMKGVFLDNWKLARVTQIYN